MEINSDAFAKTTAALIDWNDAVEAIFSLAAQRLAHEQRQCQEENYQSYGDNLDNREGIVDQTSFICPETAIFPTPPQDPIPISPPVDITLETDDISVPQEHITWSLVKRALTEARAHSIQSRIRQAEAFEMLDRYVAQTPQLDGRAAYWVCYVAKKREDEEGYEAWKIERQKAQEREEVQKALEEARVQRVRAEKELQQCSQRLQEARRREDEIAARAGIPRQQKDFY